MTSYRPDEMLVVKGFTVEITGAGGGTDVDSAWETCTGGALNIEVGDASVGTPGHKFVDEIQLRGPMTKSRKWIAQNINDTVKGKPSRFNLTIVEGLKDGSDGRRYNYLECFVTRYVYPVLSTDGKGHLYEEVTIKPERIEMK